MDIKKTLFFFQPISPISYQKDVYDRYRRQ